MDRKVLRNAIIVLGLVVAVIHLVILNVMYFNQTGIPNVMFTFAGLAFLFLLGGVTLDIKFLSGMEAQKWLHYVFIALTLATALGFFLVENEVGAVGLGYFSVLAEALLMVALFMHMQQVLAAPVADGEMQAVSAEAEPEMEAAVVVEEAPVQKAVEVEG